VSKPISVIIVNFNGGPLLSDCVRSVLASSVSVEVFVSDNRSTDNSIFELRCTFPSEPRLKIIENTNNLGFARANNIALPQARGDFILFLNPDCIIEPDTIREMLAVMENHPNAGMAGCLIRNPDGSEQPGCRRNIPTPWRTFIRLARLNKLAKYHPRFESYIQTGLPMPDGPLAVEAISGAFMLARRSAIDTVGPMDEGYFMHCEDLDWCMRFRQARLDILFVPSVEIMHVGGVCSASRPISVEYYKHKGMVRFYRKFFRYQYPTLLMWLVMTAIGIRFLLRIPAYLFPRPNPTTGRGVSGATHSFFLDAKEGIHNAIGSESKRKAIVTGATSLIGDYLLPELLGSGFEVHAISRNPPNLPALSGLHWHRINIVSEPFSDTFGADLLIHLAPLSTLPSLLEHLGEGSIKQVIAFGSTSLFTKYQSGYEKERLMAHGLKTSEAKLSELCSKYCINWTVFRPTLVYRLGRDKNITTIAQFIQKFGFFPLVGKGNGLRQPVHAQDLAKACISALDNPVTYGKTYNLSGGETLTYREMVQRISVTLGKKSRIINIPLPLLRFFLLGLSYIPHYRHLTPEMANRINFDMCFDHVSASQDLCFAPRSFLEGDPG
jgi:GT2 family glycosyltransferase/nucleoside-diphosphate-sugar epimerase